MIITSGEDVPGKKIKGILGIVEGSVVQSKNVFSDIGASLKTLIGGEINTYTELISKARKIAQERMIKEAERIGADAVICMRFSTSSIMQGASEILAYGTAVKF